MPRRCHQVIEDARRAHDCCLLGIRQRHLDDLDAEKGRIGILVRRRGDAAGQLAGRPHAGRAGDVHVDVGRIVGIDQQRVRVRAAAGLHVADVSRIADVADVEDAETAQTVRADGVPHSLRTAVESTGEALAGDEEQIPVDRNVALGGWADVCRGQSGPARIGNIPDLPAVVVPLNCVVAAERQVGVRHAQKVLRRWRLGENAQVPHCLAGILQSRAQTDTRIRTRWCGGHVACRRRLRGHRRRSRAGATGRGQQSEGDCQGNEGFRDSRQ